MMPRITREALYVRCSRATAVEGLYIYEKFVSPKAPDKDYKVTKEMAAKKKTKPFQFGMHSLQDEPEGKLKIIFDNCDVAFVSLSLCYVCGLTSLVCGLTRATLCS